MPEVYISHNPVIYAYFLIPLIVLSPWLFYRIYLCKEPDSKIAFRETLSVWLNVILWGTFGSLFASFIESILSLESNSVRYSLGNGQRLYGGIVFVLLYYYYVNGAQKLVIIDVLALITLPLFAVGKIGCLLAGHTGCAGTLSNLPIGVWFENSTHTGYDYLHPKQAYDGLFYILLLVTLIVVYSRRKKLDGYLGLIYIFTISIYTCLSSIISNEKSIILGFKLAQVFSLALLLVGCLYLKYKRDIIATEIPHSRASSQNTTVNA
jgi:prolipoprotein diacylglyceryltransferase